MYAKNSGLIEQIKAQEELEADIYGRKVKGETYLSQKYDEFYKLMQRDGKKEELASSPVAEILR